MPTPGAHLRDFGVPYRYRACLMESNDVTAQEQADLSTTCLQCGSPMREEHAHYRCPTCGWRDSCCDAPY